MNLSDILSDAESWPLTDVQQAMIKFTTLYHKRLAAYRKARQREMDDCQHSWTTVRKLEGRCFVEERCTKCPATRKVDSGD